jgi:hypothetical protein
MTGTSSGTLWTRQWTFDFRKKIAERLPASQEEPHGIICLVSIYESFLKSSWSHLITPSPNFVEVRWRSLFRSTSLGKRCASYNAPPTSRKRAAERWSFRNFLVWTSLFMVGKVQKSHGVRSGLYGGYSNGVPPIHFFQAEHRIQFRYRPMRITFKCFLCSASYFTVLHIFYCIKHSTVLLLSRVSNEDFRF